jgi:uncharacterized protein YjaG (DUF416 family)
MSLAFSTDYIDLHFEDQSGQVRVIPPDKDLMILSVKEAIEACRAFNDQIDFKSQFDALLNALGAWINARREKFSEAFLTTRDAGLLLLIVMKSSQYDVELESQITELDMAIANDADYALIPFSALAIPACPADSVHSFLSRKLALRYVIDGDRK